jgi:hypothetical protein
MYAIPEVPTGRVAPRGFGRPIRPPDSAEFREAAQILLQSRGAAPIESRLIENRSENPSPDRVPSSGFQNFQAE